MRSGLSRRFVIARLAGKNEESFCLLIASRSKLTICSCGTLPKDVKVQVCDPSTIWGGLRRKCSIKNRNLNGVLRQAMQSKKEIEPYLQNDLMKRCLSILFFFPLFYSQFLFAQNNVRLTSPDGRINFSIKVN